MERLWPPHRPRAMGPKRKNAATGFAGANRVCDVFVVEGQPPLATCGDSLARGGPTGIGVVFDCVHIRCCGNGRLGFRSYSGSLLANAPKVTKRSLPHHSVPRLGSACPHSGTAPRAAATGHPWPGAAKSASLPIYPLHRAYLRPSWLTGPADQNQKQIKSRAQRPTGRLEC